MKVVVVAMLGLIMLSCGSAPMARVAIPPAEEAAAGSYAEADAHFSGSDLMPAPPEFTPASEGLGYTQRDCQRLLDRRDTASAIALGLVGLGGAGGLAALIPKDATAAEERQWNTGLGITALASATAATVLGALVKSWSSSFEMNCNKVPPVDVLPAAFATIPHPAADEVDAETDGGAE